MDLRSRATLLKKFISTIPTVKKELTTWRAMAENLAEPLRTQALQSIEHKAFHCIGGSVYAHYPGVEKKVMLSLIIAFQTISDYLDNLCDRLQVTDPRAFRCLHQSFIQALQPGVPLDDYYALYPVREDIYLPTLVRSCQDLLSQIPQYSMVQPFALRLAEYYCELQVLKHISPPKGEKLLQEWTSKEFSSNLQWNEWAAASGSTLGIFYLFALSFHPIKVDLDVIMDAYFPWIQGLHILLDYLIDMSEDQTFGDLNFITYYSSDQTRDASLLVFSRESKKRCLKLPHPAFHRTVVDGIIALYGSDPKVKDQKLQNLIQHLAGDRLTLVMLSLCRVLRTVKFL